MIIAFCGHADYINNLEDEQKILKILENRVGNLPCEFFLGEYGAFDRFAYNCAKKFKSEHPGAKLVFVTPYLPSRQNPEYSEYLRDRFDLIVYPELEAFPKRYAISHRNRWIATQADIIIAYVTRKTGGAYTMYSYAKKKEKEIYNIAASGSANIDILRAQ